MFEAVNVGKENIPRFVISTGTGCVWTGEDWSSDGSKALVYAHPQLIERDIRRLADKWQSMPKPLRLELKAIVEIEAEQPVDLERLKQYLRRNLELDIDDEDEPLPDDVQVRVAVLWDSMKTSRKQKWS